METKVQIRLFGGFDVLADKPLEFPTRKTRLLLAYLSMYAGETVPRDRLKGLFWSDRSEAQAAGSLRRALADVRKLLADAGGEHLLRTTASTAAVVADAVEVDAVRFLCSLAYPNEEGMRQAALNYKGDLLAGLTSPDPAFAGWLQVERERFRTMAINLCEQLAAVSSIKTRSRRSRSARRPACGAGSVARRSSPGADHLFSADRAEDGGGPAICALQGCACGWPRHRARRADHSACGRCRRRARANVRRRHAVRMQQPRDAAPSKRTESELPSIAVLPLTNMSGDPGQDYFSDGLTEDIITELARFSSLSVIARNSTFVYRDRAVNLVEVGRELGAHYILEGSVRKAGERIRLTAQLIDADDGRHVWADRYDRVLEDIFEIQDELVHAIVAVLPGKIEATQRKRALRKPAESMAAYDHYLKALEHERSYDRESIVRGRQALEKAVALDPGFARAHALLAYFTFAEQWFENVIDEAALERAVAFGQRAVELDPNDNDCYAKLGTAYLSKCDYGQARHYLERALDMNPHDSWVWSHYAWLLTTVGEHEKSLEFMDRREAVDPHPPNWHWETRGIYRVLAWPLPGGGRDLRPDRRQRPLDPWAHGRLLRPAWPPRRRPRAMDPHDDATAGHNARKRVRARQQHDGAGRRC